MAKRTNQVDFCISDNESLHREICYTANDQPVDLTGFDLRMDIRINGPDSTLLLTVNQTNGIEITNLTGGEFTITLTNAQLRGILTSAGQTSGKFDYDLVLISTTGLHKKLFFGTITIERGVTEV